MDAIDPVLFVRSIPPFHAVARPLLDEALACLQVCFVPAGTRLVRAGGEPLRHLWIVRSGAVRLERDSQVLQVLEEGETFGYTSLISGEASLDAIVDEDLLAYRLPGPAFAKLLADAQFAAHFAVGLSERLKSSLEHSAIATFQPDLAAEVRRLVRRPPVWVEANATVAESARVMREERISSVLVRGDPPGIVTDRDFRNRVLAERLGPGTPVTRVLSRPLVTLGAAAPVHEAWSVLLEAGVHHLPLVEGGEIVAVLTSTDLLRHTGEGPVAVLRSVEQLVSRGELPAYSARLPQMVSALLLAGLDAARVAGFVTRLNDALVRRLLRWAEDELGPPPAPYAWIALGSEARGEQILLTDQDNALVYADAGASRREWYQALAERVGADLEAAGFPPCPGGRMARRWSGPLARWDEQIRDSIANRPGAAGIFFDLRKVSGSLDLSPLSARLERDGKDPMFVRRLAEGALEFTPPPMMLLRLRGSSSTVDLKAHGISPIVFLARCYAIEAGTRARNTLERLEAAARAGLLDEASCGAVTEAFRFLLGLRLRLQLAAVSERRAPSSKVALSALGAVERTRLKDGFRAIKHWQEASAHRWGLA
jgi:CBS domain-containing protein